MAQEVQTGAEVWLAEIEKFVRTLWMLPNRLERALTQVECGELNVRNPDVVQQVQRLESAVRQTTAGIVFAALLLGGVQLYLGNQDLPAWILFIAAIFSFFWLMRNNHSRNGR
jgi:hypothetical protein